MATHRKYMKLDVVPGGRPVRVHVSQGDIRSRTIVFSLFASCGEFSLPDGAAATLEGRLPDGGELKLSGTLSGIMATFLLPESAAAQAGEIPCSVVLRAGQERLYTEQIRIRVDAAVKRGNGE